MHLDSPEAITTTHGGGPRPRSETKRTAYPHPGSGVEGAEGQGKAKSSRNALRTGLFAAHDFIRDGEEEEYAALLTSLMSELSPDGTLEQTFAAEVMGATWRLRRCRLVEEAFGTIDDLDFDPMLDERTEKQQRSVDRARSQSHLILRRSIAELRKLQTQRTILLHAEDPDIPSLTDIKQVATALRMVDKDTANGQFKPDSRQSMSGMSMDEFEAMLGLSDAQLRQLATPGSFAAPDGLIATKPSAQPQDLRSVSFCNPAPAAAPARQEPGSSFCKPATNPEPGGVIATRQAPKTQGRGRNAPCPCGSGVKFKRCCGRTGTGLPNSSPATLNRAA